MKPTTSDKHEYETLNDANTVGITHIEKHQEGEKPIAEVDPEFLIDLAEEALEQDWYRGFLWVAPMKSENGNWLILTEEMDSDEGIVLAGRVQALGEDSFQDVPVEDE